MIPQNWIMYVVLVCYCDFVSVCMFLLHSLCSWRNFSHLGIVFVYSLFCFCFHYWCMEDCILWEGEGGWSGMGRSVITFFRFFCFLFCFKSNSIYMSFSSASILVYKNDWVQLNIHCFLLFLFSYWVLFVSSLVIKKNKKREVYVDLLIAKLLSVR